MNKPTFRTITCGDLVTLDGRRCRFLGFTGWTSAERGSAPLYANWDEAAEGLGVSSFKELDELSQKRRVLPRREHSVYAKFVCIDGRVIRRFDFGVYRYNGYWALGSSAERATLNGDVRTVINCLTGKPVEIAHDTPLCCDPSSETYHSM